MPAVAGRGLDLGRSDDREASHQGGEREGLIDPLPAWILLEFSTAYPLGWEDPLDKGKATHSSILV